MASAGGTSGNYFGGETDSASSKNNDSNKQSSQNFGGETRSADDPAFTRKSSGGSSSSNKKSNKTNKPKQKTQPLNPKEGYYDPAKRGFVANDGRVYPSNDPNFVPKGYSISRQGEASAGIVTEKKVVGVRNTAGELLTGSYDTEKKAYVTNANEVYPTSNPDFEPESVKLARDISQRKNTQQQPANTPRIDLNNKENSNLLANNENVKEDSTFKLGQYSEKKLYTTSSNDTYNTEFTFEPEKVNPIKTASTESTIPLAEQERQETIKKFSSPNTFTVAPKQDFIQGLQTKSDIAYLEGLKTEDNSLLKNTQSFLFGAGAGASSVILNPLKTAEGIISAPILFVANPKGVIAQTQQQFTEGMATNPYRFTGEIVGQQAVITGALYGIKSVFFSEAKNVLKDVSKDFKEGTTPKIEGRVYYTEKAQQVNVYGKKILKETLTGMEETRGQVLTTTYELKGNKVPTVSVGKSVTPKANYYYIENIKTGQNKFIAEIPKGNKVYRVTQTVDSATGKGNIQVTKISKGFFGRDVFTTKPTVKTIYSKNIEQPIQPIIKLTETRQIGATEVTKIKQPEYLLQAENKVYKSNIVNVVNPKKQAVGGLTTSVSEVLEVKTTRPAVKVRGEVGQGITVDIPQTNYEFVNYAPKQKNLKITKTGGYVRTYMEKSDIPDGVSISKKAVVPYKARKIILEAAPLEKAEIKIPTRSAVTETQNVKSEYSIEFKNKPTSTSSVEAQVVPKVKLKTTDNDFLNTPSDKTYTPTSKKVDNVIVSLQGEKTIQTTANIETKAPEVIVKQLEIKSKTATLPEVKIYGPAKTNVIVEPVTYYTPVSSASSTQPLTTRNNNISFTNTTTAPAKVTTLFNQQRREIAPVIKTEITKETALQKNYNTVNITGRVVSPSYSVKVKPEIITENVEKIVQEQKKVQQEVSVQAKEIIKPRVTKTIGKPMLGFQPIIPKPVPTVFFSEFDKKPTGKFSVEVRKKGKFKKVAEYENYLQASARGVFETLNTASASFRITNNEGIIDQKLMNQKYYTSKREKGVQIQKTQYRISTPGEKKEIPGKAFILNKARKIWG